MNVIDAYPDGLCPDCQAPIDPDATDGDACANCGHVFWSVQDADSDQSLLHG